MDRRQLVRGALLGVAAFGSEMGHAKVLGGSAQLRADRSPLEKAVVNLVAANRIIANQGVVDAYGHVSVRHPTDSSLFLISRSKSPDLVTKEDVLQFHLDGTPVVADGPPAYLERFIHAAIYAARPDVSAVLHAHSPEVLPYTVSSNPWRPVIQNAGAVGAHVGVWDIRKKFGDTNLLVTDLAKGADLARELGHDKAVLMRGHGYTAAGASLIDVVRIAVALRLNFTVLSEANQLGEVVTLTDGEIEKISAVSPTAPELRRAWEYWAAKAGVADMLK